MQFIGVLKRILPFFLTFAVGLFIASFFVTLPTLERKHRSHKFSKCKKVNAQNEELRRDNDRLRSELEYLRSVQGEGIGYGSGSGHGSGWAESDWNVNMDVPPVPEAPLAPPPPPPAPIREMKMKTVTVK